MGDLQRLARSRFSLGFDLEGCIFLLCPPHAIAATTNSIRFRHLLPGTDHPHLPYLDYIRFMGDF